MRIIKTVKQIVQTDEPSKNLNMTSKTGANA